MTSLRPSSESPAWLRLGRFAFAAACALTLFAAFAPQNDAPHIFPWDKAEHFTAFYVLGVLAVAAFPRVKAAWLAAGLMVLGGLIEIIQSLPAVGRDADVFDWVADSVGVACALGPLALAWWRAPRRQR